MFGRAVAAALVLCSSAPLAAQDTLTGALTWSPPEHGPSRGPVEAQDVPPSLWQIHASAWIGSPIGLALGALLGFGVATVVSSSCPRGDAFEAALCVDITRIAGAYFGAWTGSYFGAGIGAWVGADSAPGGGRGWMAFLGAVVGPVVAMVIATILTLTERNGIGVLFLAPALSVVAPLGATLFYELGRSL